MRAVASAICAVAISGCLIVRVDEHRVEDPCPTTPPTLLADANGPLALGDAVYFVSLSQMLSRLPFTGGAPSELLTERLPIAALAVDTTDLYIATSDGAVVRYPLDGSAPTTLATGFADITAIVADDTSVVWEHMLGLDRWSKANQTVEHLTDATYAGALAAFDRRYYFNDAATSRLRRTPPTEDLATVKFVGALVVDARGVYYADLNGLADLERATAIHMIPHDGSTPITIVDELPPITALAADDDNLYFLTESNDRYRVRQVSRSGGTVRTLACGTDRQYRSQHIAVAGGFVYWSDPHELYRIARAEPSAP